MQLLLLKLKHCEKTILKTLRENERDLMKVRVREVKQELGRAGWATSEAALGECWIYGIYITAYFILFSVYNIYFTQYTKKTQTATLALATTSITPTKLVLHANTRFSNASHCSFSNTRDVHLTTCIDCVVCDIFPDNRPVLITTGCQQTCKDQRQRNTHHR